MTEASGTGDLLKKARSFTTVNSVLNRVVSRLGLDKRLKEHSLMTLWPTIIGEPLCQRSRPLFIDSERNFVVSVADAATGQEISMRRTTVVQQLKRYASALGVEISSMRLDLKHYHSRPIGFEQDGTTAAQPLPSTADLTDVTLTGEDMDELRRLNEELAQRSPAMCGRIAHVVEQGIRWRRWQLNNGCTVCASCASPAQRLLPSRGESGKSQPVRLLCPECYYAG